MSKASVTQEIENFLSFPQKPCLLISGKNLHRILSSPKMFFFGGGRVIFGVLSKQWWFIKVMRDHHLLITIRNDVNFYSSYAKQESKTSWLKKPYVLYYLEFHCPALQHIVQWTISETLASLSSKIQFFIDFWHFATLKVIKPPCGYIRPYMTHASIIISTNKTRLQWFLWPHGLLFRFANVEREQQVRNYEV